MKQTYLCRCPVFALLWRILTVAACCGGLIPMLSMPSTNTLSYFTMQSNIMVAVMFAILAVGTLIGVIHGKKDTVFHLPTWLQLGITFYIQITFLVYALLLSNTAFSMSSDIAFSNLLLHYIVPLMALADWVLFMPHGTLNYKHPLLWLVYPAAYVIFCFIRAELGEPFPGGARFPYFFMDADIQGLKLLYICPLFFGAFFGLGCLLTFFDRLLGGKKAKNKK